MSHSLSLSRFLVRPETSCEAGDRTQIQEKIHNFSSILGGKNPFLILLREGLSSDVSHFCVDRQWLSSRFTSIGETKKSGRSPIAGSFRVKYDIENLILSN
jgi:hypothetical protein